MSNIASSIHVVLPKQLKILNILEHYVERKKKKTLMCQNVQNMKCFYLTIQLIILILKKMTKLCPWSGKEKWKYTL